MGMMHRNPNGANEKSKCLLGGKPGGGAGEGHGGGLRQTGSKMGMSHHSPKVVLLRLAIGTLINEKRGWQKC